MAPLEICAMLVRKPRGESEGLVPAIRERREVPVQSGSQFPDQLRKRIGEVLVLATTEAVSRHHDATAIQLSGVVTSGQRRALLGDQQPLDDGMAVVVEIPADTWPVAGEGPFLGRRGRQERYVRGGHHGCMFGRARRSDIPLLAPKFSGSRSSRLLELDEDQMDGGRADVLGPMREGVGITGTPGTEPVLDLLPT